MDLRPKRIARKHVTLIRYEKSGKTCFELLGPSGQPIEAFSIFNSELKKKFNTRLRYCMSLSSLPIFAVKVE